ncbi:hypothetical protein LUCX_78 [Xanthomonas phage vB_XciM_LucasX]|nr:hypothetical protein LUCX_78 [Xanthomonas phage vB_XciM_LucasX]
MSEFKINEHRAELASSAGFNPTVAHDSSARVQMMGSHLSQALPVIGCETRRILTGMEREFGRATFKIEMPVDAEIIKVIPKYPATIGQGGIKKNPTTAVIYMNVDTKVFDILEFDSYHCMHQHFGFNYVFTKDMKRLVPKAHIPAGTVLGHSPTLDEQGNYRIGLNAKVAMMSVPGIIEDGIVASESFCKRNTTKCIETRDCSWGKNFFPLNLYGDENHYKPFPDIGDRIREDGLIFAIRKVPSEDDIMMAPLTMGRDDLNEVRYFFDRCEYGHPGALVTDITVRHVDRPNPPTPAGMEEQTAKYYEAACLYHQQILDEYQRLANFHRERLVISPKFQAMVIEARMYLPCPLRGKSTQMYQLQPLDDWRVDLTYEYDFVPNIGSKLTGLHGDKGVICQVWPDKDMPVDAWGNRAELIVAALSTMDRMNIGRPIEHEVNGNMEMVSEEIRAGLKAPSAIPIDPQIQYAMDQVRAAMAERGQTPAADMVGEQIRNYVAGDVNRAYNVLLDFYGEVSPKMRELFDEATYKGNAQYHVDDVVRNGMFLWVPMDTPKPWIHLQENEEGKVDSIGGAAIDLMRKYPARRGPVWYRGRSGTESVTVDDIMIANTYMVLLEKTGSDWSGVASARHQHHGLPTKLSKSDRFSLPSRANPVRIMGEAEVRLSESAVYPLPDSGEDAVAEILEMSNSPAAHKNVVENILRARYPSNIDCVLDREKIPHGSSRSQVYVSHSLQCAGLEFFYVDHTDEEDLYPMDPIGGLKDMGLADGEGPDEDDDDSDEDDGPDEIVTAGDDDEGSEAEEKSED